MEKFSILRPCEEGASSDAQPLPVRGKGCLLDTVALPMHNRTCRSVMGLLVGNAKTSNRPASKNYFGFNVNFNDVPLENANALHIHKAFEYFMAFSGDFTIQAGDRGRSSVMLRKHDMVVVPAWVKRCFRCTAGREQMHHCAEMQEPGAGPNSGLCALILAGVAGEAWVQWSPETVAEARRNGVRCSDRGVLIDEGAEATEEEPLAQELDCTQDELESYVYRAADRPRVAVPYGDGDVRFEYVDVQPGPEGAWKPESGRNYCVWCLEGPTLTLTSHDAKGAGGNLHTMEVLIAPAGGEWSLSLPKDADRSSLLYLVSSNMTSASFPAQVLEQLYGAQQRRGG